MEAMSKTDLLIELQIQNVIVMMVEEQNIEYQKALSIFFQSELCNKLLDIQTGLYLQSPAYVYDLLKDEQKYGKFVQQEI